MRTTTWSIFCRFARATDSSSIDSSAPNGGSGAGGAAPMPNTTSHVSVTAYAAPDLLKVTVCVVG